MEVKLTDKNFKQEVLKSDLPCLVDFWAEWCMPCQMVAPVIEAIAKKYKEKLKVCKLNVDEARNTAAQYEIFSIPSLLIFKNGEVADKVIGAVSQEELENTIKPYI